jgi:hypothetical protein
MTQVFKKLPFLGHTDQVIIAMVNCGVGAAQFCYRVHTRLSVDLDQNSFSVLECAGVSSDIETSGVLLLFSQTSE